MTPILLTLATLACLHPASRDIAAVLKLLPSPWWSAQPYTVDSYIKAASLLQNLGKTAAIEKLKGLANANATHSDKVFILCRMLFKAKPGKMFRAPEMGIPHICGSWGTFYPDPGIDWPLEPIELVDGVPFLITEFHGAIERSETSKAYLEYCENECEWNDYLFVPKTDAEMKAALRKLLSSGKVSGVDHRIERFFNTQLNAVPSSNAALTPSEEADIRDDVSNRGLGICGADRMVVVPKRISEIYTDKPIGTLQLLLDIAKKGKPDNVKNAAGYAVALANPVMASLYLYLEPKTLDEKVEDGEMTTRQRIIVHIKELLEKHPAFIFSK